MDAKPEILQGYREVMNCVEEEGAALSQVQSGGDRVMLDLMRRTQELFTRGGELGPRVAELDSSALAMLSGSVRKRVCGIDTSLVTFQPMQFAGRLAAQISDDGDAPGAAFWAGLGRLVTPWFAPTPRLRFLHGTLPARDAPPPERLPRAPRVKSAPVGDAVTPDKLAAGQPQPEATRHQVNRMYRALRKLAERSDNGSVPMFEFTYHPTSFSTTVENVFHLSILVRERLAEVRLDGDGLPTIRPLTDVGSGGGQGTANDDAVCHQLLMKLDHDSWQMVVKSFNIHRPMMPDVKRQPPAGAAQPPPKRKQ